MINIKGLSIATDGNFKRISTTYDVIDEDGKIIKPNQRMSRIVSDEAVLDGISVIESYALGFMTE